MTLLAYPHTKNVKSRSLPVESMSGPEEAAIYDLIFEGVPLRQVAKQIGLSYQGVYIRALAYMQLWIGLGAIKMDKKYLQDLRDNFRVRETKIEGEANDSILTIE